MTVHYTWQEICAARQIPHKKTKKQAFSQRGSVELYGPLFYSLSKQRNMGSPTLRASQKNPEGKLTATKCCLLHSFMHATTVVQTSSSFHRPCYYTTKTNKQTNKQKNHPLEQLPCDAYGPRQKHTGNSYSL